ncbi:MAG: hypothetical protein A2Z83_08325 [Omnitrophica bacterium GWA2_52_8]|nr:MAG: hypothetical protein A2Z83_08325 [Omnitrophica bacterium GWA2_52_8]
MIASVLEKKLAGAAHPIQHYGILRLVMYLIAITHIGVAPFIQTFMLERKERIPAAKLTDAVIENLCRRRMQGMLAIMALSQATAIYGLILMFLTHAIGDFYFLSAIALAAIVFFFPRPAQWEAWVLENTSKAV